MTKDNRNNIFAKLWKKYLPFIKFCLVGTTNVLIYYTIYYILLILNINYLAANTIAYIMGILNGYI